MYPNFKKNYDGLLNKKPGLVAWNGELHQIAL